jgi:hypothetical protein
MPKHSPVRFFEIFVLLYVLLLLLTMFQSDIIVPSTFQPKEKKAFQLNVYCNVEKYLLLECRLKQFFFSFVDLERLRFQVHSVAGAKEGRRRRVG